MGADFIFVAVPLGYSREEALANLNALTDQELIDRLRFGQYDPRYYDDWYTFDDENNAIGVNRDELMPILINAVNVTYNVAEGRYRSGGYYQMDDVCFAVCGGETWGDSPEHYDDLCVVHELGVTIDRTKKLSWV